MKKLKLIALFAALIAALAIYQYLKELAKPVETPRTGVVVAAVDIPENTLITPEMVQLRPVATEALLEGCLQETESVVGMVLSSDVYAGEQLTSNRLVRVGEAEAKNTTLAYVVADGMRAITLSVNQITGLAGMIRPGNRVDLVMNYTKEQPGPDGQPEKTPAAQLLLEKLEVLAVDSVLSRDGSTEYASLTLQVTPEQAVEISLAESNGSLRILLRSSLDDSEAGNLTIELDSITE